MVPSCSPIFPIMPDRELEGMAALRVLREPPASSVFLKLILSAPVLWLPALCSDEASLAVGENNKEFIQ